MPPKEPPMSDVKPEPWDDNLYCPVCHNYNTTHGPCCPFEGKRIGRE